MTNEDIAVTLAGHTKEISSLTYRVDNIEKLQKSINDLALNIKELAVNVSSTSDRLEYYETRQQRQGERIGELEKQRTDKYNMVSAAFVTALISAIVTLIFSMII